MHKDPLPGDFDILAQDHAVGFVVTIGERRIKLHVARTFHRLARPQGQPWGMTWDRTRDGFFFLVWRQRDHVANPDFVGEDCARGEHFHPADHDAVVLLAHDAEGRHRQVALLVKRRITGRLGRQHGVDRVEIVVTDVPVVGEQMVRWWVGEFVHLMAMPVTKLAT